MNYKHLIKTIVISCAMAMLATAVNAATFTVPGTSDPWLANAAVDNLGTPEPADVAPDESPVFAGFVTPGATVSWSATGEVGHPGDPAGPDGVGGNISRIIGANNGIADLAAPIDSLIGVWAFPGGGTPFFMGSSGSAVVPAGATELFLGTMDGFGWANNVGAFRVQISGVPDTGSTVALLGCSAVFLAAFRRKVTS